MKGETKEDHGFVAAAAAGLRIQETQTARLSEPVRREAGAAGGGASPSAVQEAAGPQAWAEPESCGWLGWAPPQTHASKSQPPGLQCATAFGGRVFMELFPLK